MKIHYALWGVLLTLFISCSDYDEQDFTVLLPNAGEDQVVFTEESGNSVPLDGSESTDVNGLGFEYRWEIASQPEGVSASIEGSDTKNPTLVLSEGVSGRFEISLIIFRGDQLARDFVNIDVNPVFAELLFVNAIDSGQGASLNIPAVGIAGEEVAALSADATYYDIDLNIAANNDGEVELSVDYDGNTLQLTETLSALGSYTLYLVGTADNPELLLITKTRNQNTIPPNLVGLDFVNLAPETENVVLFIDASAFGYGILPIDTLFNGLGLPESFGALNFKQSSELFYPAANIFPVPIWATINGQRVSNDSAIQLPTGQEGNFGSFLLFPDSSAEHGHTLSFINNSELLPE